MENGSNKTAVIHAFVHLRAQWRSESVRLEFGFYQNHYIEGPLAEPGGPHGSYIVHAVPINALPETISIAESFTKHMSEIVQECCTEKIYYDDRNLLLMCFTKTQENAYEIGNAAIDFFEKMGIDYDITDLSDDCLGCRLKNKPSWLRTTMEKRNSAPR